MVVRINHAAPGFSLVEVLVVVAVLSVLAVGVSTLSLRAGGAVPRAVEFLRSDAADARHQAMLSGVDHALIFVADGWTVGRRSAAGWSDLRAQRPAGVEVIAPAKPWVLRADGFVSALSLRLAAGSDSVQCMLAADQTPVCR